ncbi:MAG: hypothetical protein U0X74_15440 [Anaerolineales bacterium]
MVDFFSWQAILGYIFVIVLVLMVTGFNLTEFVEGFFDKTESHGEIEEINKAIEEISKYKDAIFLAGGVLAPAVIVSAKRVVSWGGLNRRDHSWHLIDFEVDVFSEGIPPFRTRFRNEIYRPSFVRANNEEMLTEHGRKVWVTYDPENPQKAYLDHYDEDHETAMKEREINGRRAAFNKLTESNEYLKIRGEQAEALIARVDDLNLPYPLKNSRAVHIYFEVTSKDGSPFQAEGNVLIGDAAVKKYSVGKKVFVRFDPQNPKWAVLDTERNKTL